jgi:hypothetical protein
MYLLSWILYEGSFCHQESLEFSTQDFQLHFWSYYIVIKTSSHSDILCGCGCFPMRIDLFSIFNFYHDYNLFTFFVSILNVSIPCSVHLWNTCKTLLLVITFHWHQQKDLSKKKGQTFWNHWSLFLFFNYPNSHQYNVFDLTLWTIHLLTRITSINCCLFNILQPP